MASIEWLEQELSTIDAAVILVAHDRWFLESVATSVLELEGGSSTFFPGKWHVWRQEKAARLAIQAKFAERQAEDIARLERFVARFRYGTKSRQAQAKLKQIARIEAERVEAPRPARRTLGFEFLKPARSGRMVVEAEGFDLAAGAKPLLDGRRARARARRARRADRAERLGQVDAARGDRRRPRSAGSATASSSRTSPSTRSSWTSAAACSSARWARPACSARRRRRCSAASSSPAGTTHDKPVVALSGGERRRLALALVVASGANFLVLDEPTNHLDLESREALEAALEAFPGTVLLVSHDRAVLDAVAERIVAVEDGRLRSYPGGWADYARIRADESAPPRRRRRSARRSRDRRRPRAVPSELEQIEASIQARELELAELERQLAEDWGNAETLAAHTAAREDLQPLLERWEQLFEAAQA